MARTFFITLEETFGSGIGWSVSPTSVLYQCYVARRGDAIRTLEHVLDKDGALGDLLVHDKLLVVRRDEKNHDDKYGFGGVSGIGGGTGVKQRRARVAFFRPASTARHVRMLARHLALSRL